MIRTFSPFVILCAFAAVWPQDISFSVSADRTSAMLGERIQVTAQIVSNKQLSGSFAPQVPKSDDFDLLGTNQNSSQSTNIQLINGKMMQSVSITYSFYYSIAPKRLGAFTFPALTTVVGGKPYTSNSFVITVGKDAPQPSEVHVTLSVSKRSLYQGEQTLLTVKVAQKAGAQVQMSQPGFSGLVDRLEKGLSKDFAIVRLTNQLKSVGEMVNGEKEIVIKIQYALFPLASGDLSIPPVPFEYASLKRVQGRRGVSPFDDFFPDADQFFGGGVQQIVKSVLSNGITIHSSQLPPAPAGFSGAVGSFSMSVGADPKSVPSGEAVTLSVAIRGDTRPGSMGDIVLPQLSDCEVFAPEKHVSVDTTQNGITCLKGYKYLLIPRQEGTLSIPPLSWAYFDPSAAVYKTLKSEPISIAVTKGKAVAAGQTRYLTQEEIRQVGQDIRYIKTSLGGGRQTDRPYRNPIFFLLFPLPFLIAVFSLLYKMQAQRYEKDASLALRQKAAKTAFKTIAVLKKNAASIPATDFLATISGCLEDFITNKFGFSATGATLDELRHQLVKRHVASDLVEGLASFFESMDVFRFGMRSLDAASRAGMLEKTGRLVRDLAKHKPEAS